MELQACSHCHHNVSSQSRLLAPSSLPQQGSTVRSLDGRETKHKAQLCPGAHSPAHCAAPCLCSALSEQHKISPEQSSAGGHSPRKGTPACLASSSPPPLEKMFVHSWRRKSSESARPEPRVTGQELPGPEQSQLLSTLQPQAFPVPCPLPVLLRRAEPKAGRVSSPRLTASPSWHFPIPHPRLSTPHTTKKSPEQP